MCRLKIGLLLFLLLCPSLAAQELSPELEKRADKLEARIMAPCCGGSPLNDHYSAAADQAKAEIRQLLASGMTDQQVLDDFVKRHGELILAMPPAKGFNLVAYLSGFVLLVGGMLALIVAVRFLRRRRPTVAPDPEIRPGDKVEPEYVKRLERELAQFD